MTIYLAGSGHKYKPHPTPNRYTDWRCKMNNHYLLYYIYIYIIINIIYNIYILYIIIIIYTQYYYKNKNTINFHRDYKYIYNI